MKLLKIFLLACIVMVTGIYGTEGSQPNVLWHNSTTGAVKFMPINNMIPKNTLPVVDSSNTNLLPKGMGDFTGEGKPDILFHNQNSGNLRIWEMDGTSKVNNIQVLGSSNTNLKIAGIGDFDGDGDNDIATFNTNSGALRMWVMEGTTRVANELVLTGANTNLVPRGAGDMDGDGIPDIVLRNNNSGAVRIWTMNADFTRKGNEYIRSSSNTNLELRGVMDINSDGNNDILNYNTSTGVLRAWLMDGNLSIVENATIVQDDDLDWSVRGGDNNTLSDMESANITILKITSVLILDSGVLTISTSGVVPINNVIVTGTNTANVDGAGILEVSGEGGYGDCVSTVSGVTHVDVLGTRNGDNTYELSLMTEQSAVLVTICPGGVGGGTALTGEGARWVTLSSANGYTQTIDEPVEEGTFTMEVTLVSPHTGDFGEE